MQHQVTHGISNISCCTLSFFSCYHTMRAFSFIIVQLCNGYVYGCAFSVLFSIYYVHFLFCFLYIMCIFFFLLFFKNSVLLCSNTYVQIFLLTSRVEALSTGSESNHMQLFFFSFCKIICTEMYWTSWLLDWYHLPEPVTTGILMLHSLLDYQQVGILLVSNLSQKCPFCSVSL